MTRVLISIPDKLLDKIDRKAKTAYETRSSYIRGTLLRQLDMEQTWNELRKRGSQRARALGIRTERDVDRIVTQTRLAIAREKR